ncbi:MAG: site-specific integrase [Bacteroidaceae bacterium]|nr:site-specific integrase [Bacteroidaceae bacterium]
MASIKVKFRPSTVADREGTIYYQVIHERKVRQLLTDYHIFPSEWDGRRSSVAVPYKSERQSYLLFIRERIRWDMERLAKISRKFDADGFSYTASDVVDEFHRYTHEYSLLAFMGSIIAKLRRNGKVRTAETYKVTLNSFKAFLACQAFMDEDIMLDSLNSEIMEAYEAWHQRRGVTLNTISFYTRILRAVYNRAVEGGIIENRNPFRHVYTGVEKTVKRALPLAVLRRIKQLDLSQIPALDFARDMFMMSFYLRGMSFIDMAYLKKSDLRNGYVTYRRRKTGQQLTIEWTRDMQLVLDKYPANESDYLLPIIRTAGINERCAYRNVGYNINHSLKRIPPMLGLDFHLTMYVARHSWASAAKSQGIPLSVISEGMGHGSETTTQIYLASLDTSVVDRANAVILQSLVE